MQRIPMVGRRFGRLLVVVESDEKSQAGKLMWDCLCDCGKLHTVNGAHLRGGLIQSCGCLRIDQLTIPDCTTRALNEYFASYKQCAKKRGIDWGLSLDQFVSITSKSCFYCGAPPSQMRPSGKSMYICNGIDRFDNKSGYTSGNSVPCCTSCNRAKLTYSSERFIDNCRRVWEYQCRKMPPPPSSPDFYFADGI
jgi:hypothetical protein